MSARLDRCRRAGGLRLRRRAGVLAILIDALEVVATLIVDLLVVFEAHRGAVHVELELVRHHLSIQAYQQAGETETHIEFTCHELLEFVLRNTNSKGPEMTLDLRVPNHLFLSKRWLLFDPHTGASRI